MWLCIGTCPVLQALCGAVSARAAGPTPLAHLDLLGNTLDSHGAGLLADLLAAVGRRRATADLHSLVGAPHGVWVRCKGELGCIAVNWPLHAPCKP